ncbi:hypothetical protein D3C76_1602050 [compost metagenome]
MTQLQRLRYVRLVGEAEVQDHPEETFAVGIDLEPSRWRHPRDVFVDHRQQHHLLVQYLVMQQVV